MPSSVEATPRLVRGVRRVGLSEVPADSTGLSPQSGLSPCSIVPGLSEVPAEASPTSGYSQFLIGNINPNTCEGGNGAIYSQLKMNYGIRELNDPK